MKLCIFTPAYPGNHDVSHYAFVKQLVDAFAKMGHDCHVVVPYNFLHYKKLSSRFESYKIGSGNVFVYRPYYLSFSRFSKVKIIKWVMETSRKYAIRKAIARLPKCGIDVVYGHFWISGYRGYAYAKKHNLPLFVATGESRIQNLFEFPSNLSDFKDYVKGVICVSSKNKDESVKLGLTTESKCRVFPNAVNTNIFYMRNKIECRFKLGFPKNSFIVAFVGWFDDRKGAKRVSDAIKLVDNVYSVFIGKGKLEPDCDGILFKGSLPHDSVPLYLNAADCFVLPTKAEGCCNAVIEAMACGLPIISSDLPFNWDVLNENNSILVDPNEIEEISEAIRRMRDDLALRMKLSEGAQHTAESLSIDKRADAILSFIREKIDE